MHEALDMTDVEARDRNLAAVEHIAAYQPSRVYLVVASCSAAIDARRKRTTRGHPLCGGGRRAEAPRDPTRELRKSAGALRASTAPWVSDDLRGPNARISSRRVRWWH